MNLNNLNKNEIEWISSIVFEDIKYSKIISTNKLRFSTKLKLLVRSIFAQIKELKLLFSFYSTVTKLFFSKHEDSCSKYNDLLYKMLKDVNHYGDKLLDYNIYSEQLKTPDKNYKKSPNGQNWERFTDSEGWEYFACHG